MTNAEGNLSNSAINLICGLFWLGEKSTVRSLPPHEFISRHETVLKELLKADLITAKPYNDHGVIEYRGTDPCHEIWRGRLKDLSPHFRKMVE